MTDEARPRARESTRTPTMPSAAESAPSCAALAILCALSAFPPLTMEIYIPSLPNLQAEMQASTTTTLATISVYTAGFSDLFLTCLAAEACSSVAC